MPDPITGMITGGMGIVNAISGNKQAKRASQAQGAASDAQVELGYAGLDAQERATNMALEESRRQFDASRGEMDQFRQSLQPWIDSGRQGVGTLQSFAGAGEGAISGLEQFGDVGLMALQSEARLSGAMGPEAYQEEIEMIESSPGYFEMLNQAEESLLGDASAMGKLGDTETKSLMATLRPSFLQNAIQNKMSQYGAQAGRGGNVLQQLANMGYGAGSNVASMGQASAAGQGATFGQTNPGVVNLLAQSGRDQSNMLQQIGGYRAGGILGQAGSKIRGQQSLMDGLGQGFGLAVSGKNAGIF